MSHWIAILYKKDSKGKIREWRIRTEDNLIITEHGIKGGKMVEERRLAEAKNIGRANETTPEQQARLEAESTILNKLDKNYKYSVKELDDSDVWLPMLAHNYEKRGKDIEFPCYVQPKIDGIRCLAYYNEEGELVLQSRTGKLFKQPFEELRSEIRNLLPENIVWDGELYTTELTFEELTGAVRREKYDPVADKIKYYVFDCIDTKDLDKVYIDRLEDLPSLDDELDYIYPVQTIETESLEDITGYLDNWLLEGYEGLILRNITSPYKIGHRSKDLQKYKKFQDEEYTIIGAHEGTGRDTGTVIWICEGSGGQSFDVRPRGTLQQRRSWWNNYKKFIGKKLTVRYQNLTEKGLPRFPVGVAIRDYE